MLASASGAVIAMVIAALRVPQLRPPGEPRRARPVQSDRGRFPRDGWSEGQSLV